MRILFVHNNFPAQFRHVSQALVRRGHEVTAIGSQTARPLPGVRLVKYNFGGQDVANGHSFARRFELECRRAEQVMYAALDLSLARFQPDLIVVHSGWGENLPLRAIFERARIVTYCEFYYRTTGQDVGFDPEFPTIGLDGNVALSARNASTLLSLAESTMGISPTQWQKDSYPELIRPMIEVVHEGVDTTLASPDPSAVFRLPDGRALTRSDEVLTYVSRNLEPIRGYHIFMRALPRVLRERPNAQIVIIGGSGCSYGPLPPPGTSWKEIYRREVARDLDPDRVHFLGQLPHTEYLKALQVSTTHVYLTYPFVLSWSMVEAMSVGCTLITAPTPPVAEVVDENTAILVPFFDVDALSRAIVGALRERHRYAGLGMTARARAVERFDHMRVCVPRTIELLESLA